MKTLLIAAAATLGMAGLALADEAKAPSVMSDSEMDAVVGGDTLVELKVDGNTLLSTTNSADRFSVICITVTTGSQNGGADFNPALC